MTENILIKRKSINFWHFVWISVVFSELLTAFLNTAQGFIWFGKYSPQLVMIGALDALIVPLIVAPIVIYFMRHAAELKKINEQLQQEIENRMHAEQALVQSEVRYRALINAINESEFLMDPDGNLLVVNETTASRLGKSVDDLNGKCIYDYIPSDVARLMEKKGNEVIRTGRPVRFEDKRWGRYFDNSVYPVRDTQGNIATLAILEHDITERKLAEEERERLILDHLDALSSIKTLSGLLPICASCKKIRDDEGYWSQLEAYIVEHSEAIFSHGLCPECAAKVYSELDKMKTDKGKEGDR
jgi:PAS domain S-box-containing protein